LTERSGDDGSAQLVNGDLSPDPSVLGGLATRPAFLIDQSDPAPPQQLLQFKLRCGSPYSMVL